MQLHLLIKLFLVLVIHHQLHISFPILHLLITSLSYHHHHQQLMLDLNHYPNPMPLLYIPNIPLKFHLSMQILQLILLLLLLLLHDLRLKKYCMNTILLMHLKLKVFQLKQLFRLSYVMNLIYGHPLIFIMVHILLLLPLIQAFLLQLIQFLFFQIQLM